jgi:hypothetical protein
MLVTLFTIAIASLVATPLVVPAVRRFTQGRQNKEDLPLEAKVKKNKENASDLVEQDTSRLVTNRPVKRQRPAPPIIPQVSLELVKPSSSGVGSVKSPLVEVVWKSKGALRAKTIAKSDPVESFRPTPSADSLFEDALDDRHVFESTNPQDPPRYITPKQVRPLPKAAQQVKSLDFKVAATGAGEPETEGRKYQVGAEKFKMRPVSTQVTSKKPTAIPMMITATPTAMVSEQHYEVIKPSKAKVMHDFSLLDTPEEIATGERSWGGVQPLYIDFSPFFSLDSLMDITSGNYSTQNDFKRSKPKQSDQVARRSFEPNISMSEVGQVDGNPQENYTINLLRDLNSERDRFLNPLASEEIIDDEADWDEEEYQWSSLEHEKELDDLEDVPEWQSLLGLTNNFLFDLKLTQRSVAHHQQLTEQNLEDAIVFRITSGPSGPKVNDKQPKPNDQS